MGKSSNPEVEAERIRKIQAARQHREAIRRGEIPPDPEPEPAVVPIARRSSHGRSEIRHIEVESGLVFSHFVTAGGLFLDRQIDQKGRITETEADAGLPVLVPVFRRADP